MSDVKWIKITTDIFDDEKILLIESLPEADSIIVIWFKLLCLAGKINNSGVFVINDKLAYTDSMLATIFRRKEATVKLALKTFEEFGMIERVEDIITIPNWGKYQSLDSLEKKKEYQREYMQEYRAKQKNLLSKSNCKTNSKTNCEANVSSLDKEVDKEKELEKNKSKEIVDTFIEYYHSICKSLPKVKTITDKRKKAITKLLKYYSWDDIIDCFYNVEGSDFLKGKNDRGWKADIDFILREDKFVSILEGKYGGKQKTKSVSRDIEHMKPVEHLTREEKERRREEIANGRATKF